MGFSMLIILVVFAFAIIMLKLIVNSVKNRNWRRTILLTAILIAGIALIYTGLIAFITSM